MTSPLNLTQLFNKQSEYFNLALRRKKRLNESQLLIFTVVRIVINAATNIEQAAATPCTDIKSVL